MRVKRQVGASRGTQPRLQTSRVAPWGKRLQKLAWRNLARTRCRQRTKDAAEGGTPASTARGGTRRKWKSKGTRKTEELRILLQRAEIGTRLEKPQDGNLGAMVQLEVRLDAVSRGEFCEDKAEPNEQEVPAQDQEKGERSEMRPTKRERGSHRQRQRQRPGAARRPRTATAQGRATHTSAAMSSQGRAFKLKLLLASASARRRLVPLSSALTSPPPLGNSLASPRAAMQSTRPSSFSSSASAPSSAVSPSSPTASTCELAAPPRADSPSPECIRLTPCCQHRLNDVCSLIVALQALKLAENSSSSATLSYGWQRAEVLGGALLLRFVGLYTALTL